MLKLSKFSSKSQIRLKVNVLKSISIKHSLSVAELFKIESILTFFCPKASLIEFNKLVLPKPFSAKKFS